MRILFYLPILFISAFSSAQTANTITDGNWTNPLIWDCFCVPVNNYQVHISHNVVLNTNIAISGGFNLTGSLVQDAAGNRDLLINGTSFNNNGIISVRNIAFTSTNGSVYNGGTINATALSNLTVLQNYGSIMVDSLFTEVQFDNMGEVHADSLLNRGRFSNYGSIYVTWVTNDSLFSNYAHQEGGSITNNHHYYNHDSLILQNSLWNADYFENKYNGSIIIHNDMFNHHPAHTSVFNNTGSVTVMNNLYNTDTIRGSGTGIYTVSDSSANTGIMRGHIKFCDLSPPANTPFVDFNTGIIDTTVAWCTAVGLSGQEPELLVSFFPNPNSGIFTIQGGSDCVIRISDELGREVYTGVLNAQNNYNLKISCLESGIYFAHKEKGASTKIIVTK